MVCQRRSIPSKHHIAFMRKLYYIKRAQKSQQTFTIVSFWCCWRFFSLLSTYFGYHIGLFMWLLYHFFFPQTNLFVFPLFCSKSVVSTYLPMKRIKIITKLRQQCVCCVKFIFHLLKAVLTSLFTVYSIYFETMDVIQKRMVQGWWNNKYFDGFSRILIITITILIIIKTLILFLAYGSFAFFVAMWICGKIEQKAEKTKICSKSVYLELVEIKTKINETAKHNKNFNWVSKTFSVISIRSLFEKKRKKYSSWNKKTTARWNVWMMKYCFDNSSIVDPFHSTKERKLS